LTLDKILSALRAERDRLEKAISALEGSAITESAVAGPRRSRKRGRRTMSAEARQKISEAKRKWWAKRKGKKTV